MIRLVSCYAEWEGFITKFESTKCCCIELCIDISLNYLYVFVLWFNILLHSFSQLRTTLEVVLKLFSRAYTQNRGKIRIKQEKGYFSNFYEKKTRRNNYFTFGTEFKSHISLLEHRCTKWNKLYIFFIIIVLMLYNAKNAWKGKFSENYVLKTREKGCFKRKAIHVDPRH